MARMIARAAGALTMTAVAMLALVVVSIDQLVSRAAGGAATGDADRLAARRDDVATPQLAPAARLDRSVDADRALLD
jgi:hypothetical protein